VSGAQVKRLFAHPDLNGKGIGVLRKWILWTHGPTAKCHQEVMEVDATYAQIKPITIQLLSRPMDAILQITRRHIDSTIAAERARGRWGFIRIRDLLRPIVIQTFYEMIFGQPPTPEVLTALLASNADLITTVLTIRDRNMQARRVALGHVQRALEASGGRPEVFGEGCTLTIEERAQYVLGVWMQTGVSQTWRLAMKAMCALLRTRHGLETLRSEGEAGGPYADAVLMEALRMFPGLAATDRRALRDVEVEGIRLERNTTVYLNIWIYQRQGFVDGDEFIPERWRDEELKKTSNFVPFGVGKRRCPAERLSLMLAQELMVRLLSAFDFHVASGRGLVSSRQPRYWSYDRCCVVPRCASAPFRLWAVRRWLNAALAFENIVNSVIQFSLIPRHAAEAGREYP
jgi:hypothetical protein